MGAGSTPKIVNREWDAQVLDESISRQGNDLIQDFCWGMGGIDPASEDEILLVIVFFCRYNWGRNDSECCESHSNGQRDALVLDESISL